MTDETLTILLEENEALRSRLEEAEEILRGIRQGEVDALVVSGPDGDQVFTLQHAERPYRIFVESMQEGAATLADTGEILYCNRRFAELLNTRLEKLLGTSIYPLLEPHQTVNFRRFLQQNQPQSWHAEVMLGTHGAAPLPVLVALSSLSLGDRIATCMVITDLTIQHQREHELLLLQELQSAVSQSASVEQSLDIVLQGVCARWKVVCGEAWVYSDDRSALKRAAIYASKVSLEVDEFIRAGSERNAGPSSGLLRYVWESKQPYPIDDLRRETRFTRAVQAEKADLQSGLMVPVLTGSEVVAILAFFASEKHPMDEYFVRLISTVAAQIGTFISQKQAEAALQKAHQQLEIRVMERTEELRQTNERLVQEIFTRKATEEALRASQKRVQEQLREIEAIYNTAPIGLCVLNERLEYQRINTWLAESNGLAPEAHIGHTVREILPQLADILEPRFQQILATGQGAVNVEISGETAAEPGIARNWIESWMPLQDDAGLVTGINIVVEEVTERKRAEARTRLLHELTSDVSTAVTPREIAEIVVTRIRSAVEGLYAAIGMITVDGDALQVLYDPPLSEIASTQLQLIPLDHSVPMTDAIRERKLLWIEDAESFRHQSRTLTTAASYVRSQAVVVIPMFINERVIGSVEIGFAQLRSYDAEEAVFLRAMAYQCAQALERARLYEAEQQARYQAEAADRTKMRFLAMISHELRTPLTSIRGFASTLNASDVNYSAENRRRFLSIIDEEAERMANLVDQLLDLSRVTAGTFRVTREPKPIADIFTAQEHLRLLAPEHVLHFNLLTEVAVVQVDVLRIVQVLSNLVQNAASHAPIGTSIWISTRIDGAFLRIEVADNGPGIPVEARLSVFEAFLQLDGQNQTQRKGLGLGLAICRGIVEAHGGSIWIEENRPHGAIVAFTLPLV